MYGSTDIMELWENKSMPFAILMLGERLKTVWIIDFFVWFSVLGHNVKGKEHHLSSAITLIAHNWLIPVPILSEDIGSDTDQSF